MTPLAVFLRTFLRTSAIFVGASIVFLHPPLEWSSGNGAARAQKSPIEAAVDGLLVAPLGEIGDPQALPALNAALKDKDPRIRRYAAKAISRIQQ
jgi:HEAT repeat protein